MSYQYFNHSHLLLSLRLDEGEEINYKACDRLIAEQTFYGCIACKYYLHDRCLNLPRWIKHPSHPSHSLTLLPAPTYPSGSFSCNACGSAANSFSKSCAECEFDLHLHCSSLPSTVLLDAHPHELKLTFESPYDDEKVSFVCDVCGSVADRHQWVYYCAECDFGTHLECATAAIEQPGMEEPASGEVADQSQTDQPCGSDDGANNPFKQVVDEMMENQLEMMRLQNEMNRTRMFAQLMTWPYR